MVFVVLHLLLDFRTLGINLNLGHSCENAFIYCGFCVGSFEHFFDCAWAADCLGTMYDLIINTDVKGPTLILNRWRRRLDRPNNLRCRIGVCLQPVSLPLLPYPSHANNITVNVLKPPSIEKI